MSRSRIARRLARSSATRDSSAAICFASARSTRASTRRTSSRSPDGASISSSAAGARAEKWKANAEPERDLDNIERLTRALGAGERAASSCSSRRSTCSSIRSTSTKIRRRRSTGLHAYGRNRRRLEQIVAGRFDATHRAACRVSTGPGLKKNVIYDFLHDNEVHKIDSRGVFQFYDVGRLWRDVEIAIDNELPLVHLPTEPVSVADVARAAFGIEFTNEVVADAGALRRPHALRRTVRRCRDRTSRTKTDELAGIAAFVAGAERRAT